MAKKAPQTPPPDVCELSFEDAMKIIAKVPKSVVHERTKQAKKKKKEKSR